MSDGSVIDDGDGGNATRHLNHGCEPNYKAVEFEDEACRLAIRFETLRPVTLGDELLLDYALVIDAADDPIDYPCRCGLPGSLVSALPD